jgi:hypothetical protein
MSMEHYWIDTDRRNLSTLTETCPGSTLSTTNLTLSHPGTEPGLPQGDAGDQLPESCRELNSLCTVSEVKCLCDMMVFHAHMYSDVMHLNCVHLRKLSLVFC